MVLYTDGAKVYTVSSTDHQLVPTDQVESLFSLNHFTSFLKDTRGVAANKNTHIF